MRLSLSIVPQSDDRDVYLVLDDVGKLGRAWRETDEGRTDRETVITDLMDGQYSSPFRVVAFNNAEGWSRDVSEDIADEIARRVRRTGSRAAVSRSFCSSSRQRAPAQLPLPLRAPARNR